VFGIQVDPLVALWVAFGLAIFGWMVLFDRVRRYLDER